mmetsp:Transcript_22319/g.34534  ORF Transcript_22319/g.34534 Transcript_22319/m.34534 type:complete len:179 (+) Transcript_22319:1029-1565(+)
MDELEAETIRRYNAQPEVAIQQTPGISDEALTEFERLQELFEDKQYMTMSQMRDKIYKEFIDNCSNYIVSFVLTDQLISLDANNSVSYLPREQRLFHKKLDPTSGTASSNLIRLRMNEMDHDSALEWPSTHWIFADPKTQYPQNDVLLSYDKDILSDDWTSFTLESPDEDNSPVTFGD